MYKESAANKTDYVLNGCLAEEWGAFSEYQHGFLDTPPPRNMLFALIQTRNYVSTSKPVGLLPAVGYINLVDAGKLADSQDIQAGIEKKKESIFILISEFHFNLIVLTNS